MDMILTGRPVGAQEALAMGLANRVVADGFAAGGRGAGTFALCLFPNLLAGGSAAVLEQTSLSAEEALGDELAHGMRSLAEVQSGLERFRSGEGRHGAFQ